MTPRGHSLAEACALTLILLLTAYRASAQSPPPDDDAAALDLADKTPAETTTPPRDWRVFTEAAVSRLTQRSDGAIDHAQRLSLDVHYDKTLTSGWRAVFSDRLDLAWQDELSNDDYINTLKEAYLSWQPRADRLVDLGRINLRNGVASGYNPTDYFRAGVVRSVVSINPASLKENRLGTVMLRGQTLWRSGAFTALYSPKLADAPDPDPFALDLGSTNNKDRWLIALSQRLSDRFTPQWLLYGETDASAQLGLNLTTLLNDATVAYLEWSGGRSALLRSQSLALPDDTEFRSRLATGATYTTADKLSLTLEYQYNGAGLDRADWDALRRGPPAAYAQYRSFVGTLQDMPTRENIFWFARRQDAFIVHLDLSLMQRFSVVDHSRLSWLEARYHWHRVDLALQWQKNSGEMNSEYGASRQREMWQAVVTYFF